MPERVRHPEIEDLHLAVVAQEDVSGREVAVYDAMGVSVREPARDRHRNPQGLRKRQRTVCEAHCERAAAEELQDEIRSIGGTPHVVERHDVRMREAGGRLRLRQ